MNLAKECPSKPTDLVYFLENDYLHQEGWLSKVFEAYDSPLPFDYLSLYDHKDKYIYDMYQDLRSKVMCSETHHWRTAPSTCASFIVDAGTLTADHDILGSGLTDYYFLLPSAFRAQQSIDNTDTGLVNPFHGRLLEPCGELGRRRTRICSEPRRQIMQPKIFVTQPYLPPLEEFIPYLRTIWTSKVLTNGGPFHQQLEDELCKHLGVEHLALFTNGTVALVTALQALRITGEVITTPSPFVATSHSLLWNGIKPVFVDIDPATLNLDPARIEAAITPQTDGHHAGALLWTPL